MSQRRAGSSVRILKREPARR